MWHSALLLLVLLAAMPSAEASQTKERLVPKELKCEFRVSPLGIDAARPRLSWVLEGNGRDQRQSAYRVLVSSGRGVLWDSGKVESNDQNNIEYGGKPLLSRERCEWKVQVWDGDGRAVWSAPSTWEMGFLSQSDWTGMWINDGRESPKDFYGDDPAPLFRKGFVVRQPIARARMFITGLGYYEPFLNGAKVGDQVLDPGWTDVDKRVLYSVFDVTRQLKRGENCLGVMVGNGWYNPLPLRLFGRFNLREQLTIGRPRLIVQLEIEYRDGTRETVASDRTWKVGDGPIVRNNIYLGEVVDARKEQSGWNRPGFDDSGWRTPGIAREAVGPLVAQSAPPIRATATWKAVKVSQPKPGVFIYDLGKNFAGWASFKLSVPAGTEVRFRYGELLYADGTLNPMTSVAGQIKREGVGGPGSPPIAWQANTFIAKGGGETFTPRFSFQGFRYVEVVGLAEALPLSSVTAHRLNSDVEEVGTFECSNPLLNEIQEICQRTFLSNIFSVQSDCPHRERLGYGGDIVATSEAFMANYDMAGFYAKTVRDWSDSALADGMFTDTAPFIGIQYCGVIWAMAHPLLLQQLGQYYGDLRLGKEEYEAAKRWLLLVDQKYPDGIVTEGLSDHEGLAPAPSPEMVSPMYFQSAKILAGLSRKLGRNEDAARFDQIAERTRLEYGKRFVDLATGKVGPGTQASQSMALHTGIVPEAGRAKVLEFLIKDIEGRGGKLSTGILGTKFMLNELSHAGRADLAYRIVTQPEFPGWAYMLANGATTLWEHWAKDDNTFSHNHPMFGSVSQWMMQWLGGIRPGADAVGYDQIVIQPQTPAGLDWVKSSYRSVRGKIVSNWKREGGKIRFEVEIPANSEAMVRLPEGRVQEDGKPLRRPVTNVGFSVGSGRYVFLVTP